MCHDAPQGERSLSSPRALRTGRGAVVWLTGLSGSGKTTLARGLAARVTAAGRAQVILDGDELRRGLCRDLSFSPEDRAENIRRVGEVAALMAEAGLIVICAFISPYAAGRAAARHAVAAMPHAPPFFEVFVDAPLSTCERRDVKGLYARARRGELRDVTGVDAPYEIPSAPDLRVSTDDQTIEACVDAIVERLGLSIIVDLDTGAPRDAGGDRATGAHRDAGGDRAPGAPRDAGGDRATRRFDSDP